MKRCYGCMKFTENNICEHCGYDFSKGNASHQLIAGTILLDQYLIGRVLGQGGFGITYLGWDIYLDTPIAVKEYFPNGMVMRENSVSLDLMDCSTDNGKHFHRNKERFMQEAQTLARFANVPEIVEIRNLFYANNTAYIVMEYVEGVNLKQYVKAQGGKLSVEQTFSLIKPVMRALGQVHKEGLIHRDISPDNIMILSDGTIKVLDFGAVRDVGEYAAADKPLTKSTEAILKQGYAPIEQYQNRGSLGSWTDVYALCATIYYCLTGEVPPDAPERLLSGLEPDFAGKVPQLPPAQAAVLEKGMAMLATERIVSMDALYRELFGLEITERDGLRKDAGSELGKDAGNALEKPNEFGKGDADSAEDKIALNSKRKLQKVLGGVAAVILVACIALVLWKNQQTGDGNLISLFGNNQNSDNGNSNSGDSKNGNSNNGDSEKKHTNGNSESDTASKCGDDVYWELDEATGVLLLHGTGAVYDYNDTTRPPWWKNREAVLTVEIENGITDIGSGVFAGCENLEEATIPVSVEVIHEDAFDQTDVTICGFLEGAAEQFARAKDLSFRAIGSMQEITGACGDNVTWRLVGDTLYLEGSGETWAHFDEEKVLLSWYKYRSFIRNIYVGEGITRLSGSGLFSDLENLEYVDLGNVEYIAGGVFENCGMEEIIIPESVKVIGWNFSDCKNLKRVYFLNGSESVDVSFWQCESLEEIYFSREAVLTGELWHKAAKEIYLSWYGTEINDEIIFYVYEDSDAHKYALRYQFPYVIQKE